MSDITTLRAEIRKLALHLQESAHRHGEVDAYCFWSPQMYRDACVQSNAALTALDAVRTALASPRLQLVPVSLRTANAFVQEHHRHHRPVQGAKFALAVTLSGSDSICGVAIVGRPVARHLDDGWTLEVTRLCTDGAPNACSKLYGAAWKAAKALGYTRLITYTLPEEGGASLRAAGWRLVGTRGGGTWSRPSRPRADTPDHLRGPKCLWRAPDGADKGKRPDAD